MANRNFPNKGNLYAPHCKPVLIDCSFIVDAANGNGLGLRSVKGSGMIKAIYMHTSSTPATGNPNPASGLILVQLKDNYQRYLGGTSGMISPVSGTPILVTTGTTAGLAYTIVTVGTTTAAQWQKLGLPIGVTPAVGASFIAIATTTATGSGVIEVPKATGSGIASIEVVGDPNMTIAPSASSSAGIGGSIVLVCLAATNSSTTTQVATAPADGTVIGLQMYFDDSSVLPGDGGA